MFLDGLRGLAALVVVIFHAGLYTGHTGELADSAPIAESITRTIGTYGVPTFMILSGFVLTLPVATRPGPRSKHAFWAYIGRRARRILPPYYISLLIFLGLIALVPALQIDSNTAWDNKVPVTAGGIASHLLVVHNWNTDWFSQINGPAWSVATGWQLYILFPLVLLPIWRRFGGLSMLNVATVGGVAITIFVPPAAAGGLWYATLFAMGMLAANAVVRGIRIPALSLLTVAATCSTLCILASRPIFYPLFGGVFDIGAGMLIGVAVSLLLIRLAPSAPDSRYFGLRNALERDRVVHLGTWSYSLYLVHSPILAATNLWLITLDISIPVHFAIQLFVAVTLACVLAYLFHITVERRFLTSHQKELVHS